MSPINHLHKGRVDELLATGKITSQQHAEMVELLSQDPLKTQRGQRPRTHGEKPDNFYSRLIFGLLLTVIALVFLLFTPYTHQLDEIKTALLFAATPFLLILALCDFDFQELSRRSSRPLIFLGLFAFSGILSMLLNLSNWQLAERAWWFHFAAISLCGVTAVLVNSVERVRLAMRFFVCLGLASALIGFAMYGGTLEPLYGLMKNSTWGGRSSWTTLLYVLLQSDVMYSTILANDFYSIFLAMTLPLSVGLFVVERTRAWKATAALAFITMSLALPRTRDFIGIATAAAVSLPLAAYLIYRICNRADGGRGLAPQANLVLAACGAVILMILLPKLNSNDPWLFRAVDYRPVIWSGAIAVWLFGGDASHAALDWKSILAGNGPGGFRFHFPLHRRPDFFDHGVNNVTTYAHNYYLDILCEQGIIGIVLFGAMIWFILRAAWRQIHRDTSLDLRIYQAALTAGTVAGLLAVSMSVAAKWTVVSVIFWSVIGLSIAVVRVGAGAQRSIVVPEMPRRSLSFYKTAFAGMALLFLFRSFPQGIRYFEAAQENSLGLRNMEIAEVETGRRTAHLQAGRRHFEAAIRLNPTFITSYYKLGNIQNQLGEAAESIQTYEAVRRLDPHYSEVDLNLAVMYSVLAKEQEPASDERCTSLTKAAAAAIDASRMFLKPSVQNISATILTDAAECARMKGQEAEARRYLNEARRCYERIVTYVPRTREYRNDRKRMLPRAKQGLAAVDAALANPNNDSVTGRQ